MCILFKFATIYVLLIPWLSINLSPARYILISFVRYYKYKVNIFAFALKHISVVFYKYAITQITVSINCIPVPEPATTKYLYGRAIAVLP